jgi:hypothetical protein
VSAAESKVLPNAGARVQNTNAGIIPIGAEGVFVELKVTGRNNVKTLVAYRLFQNKHSTLQANRAGV